MEITNKNLCSNELRKIALLMTKASDLGMDISGYGQADVNPNSGYTYLWLEDYPFTLYIDLGSDTIYASWVSYYDGEEVQISTEGETLHSLYQWCEELEKQVEEA